MSECVTLINSRFVDNQNDFIGCLKVDNTTTSMKTTFNCSAMTPTVCKRFCQEHGYSVAMLKQGTQCFCSEYSKVTHLDDERFLCSIPCGGDGETFCGGKETYSAYRTMPGEIYKQILQMCFCFGLVVTVVTVTVDISLQSVSMQLSIGYFLWAHQTLGYWVLDVIQFKFDH